MANNQVLAVATNLLDILGSLGDVDNRPQIQDCTTIPQNRKERKKYEYEYSM